MNYKVDEIEGIGPKHRTKLNDTGIETTNDLLERTWTSMKRKRLSSEIGIGSGFLFKWMNQANLMRVKGISGEYADLLYRVGVSNLLILSQKQPAPIMENIKELLINKPNIVKRKPSSKAVKSWIAQAQTLVDELDLPEEGVNDYTDVSKLDEVESEIRECLEAENWDSLIVFGNTLRGQVFFKLMELREQLSLAGPIEESDYSILKKEEFISRLKNPTIQENIKKNLESSGIPSEDISKYMKDLLSGKLKVPKLEENKGYQDTFKDKIEHNVFLGALGFYITILGRLEKNKAKSRKIAFNYFNDYKTEIEGVSEKEIEEAQASLEEKQNNKIEERIAKLEGNVDGRVTEIYGALVTKQLDSLEEKALMGISRLETLSKGLVDNIHFFDSLGNLAAIEKYQSNSDNEMIINESPLRMKTNIRASKVLERMLTGYSSCLYHLAINNKSFDNPLLETELKNAYGLGYESKQSNGQQATIKDILSTPKEFQNTRVQVVGMLRWQWIKEKKVFNFILMEEGAEIQLKINEVDAKRKLSQDGSFCLVTGKLGIQKNVPVLKVEKIDFSALDGESWIDMTVSLTRNRYVMIHEDLNIASEQILRNPKSALKMIKIHRYRRW